MKTDLSEYHQLVGDLFPTMEPEDAWQQFRLSEEQLAFFEEHGYVSHIKLLEDHQIEFLRDELAALMDPDHPGHHLFYEFHTSHSPTILVNE